MSFPTTLLAQAWAAVLLAGCHALLPFDTREAPFVDGSMPPDVRPPGEGLSPCSRAATGAFGGGTGAENDPYLICTAAQLRAVDTPGLEGKHFALGAEIDLTQVPQPHPRVAQPFSGTFDGRGHTIKGFLFSGSDHAGLFAALSRATIRDLKLSGAEVKGGNVVGILAGRAEASSITGCTTSGAVEGRNLVGGLIGATDGYSSVSGGFGFHGSSSTRITDSSSSASVIVLEGTGGGLVGWSAGRITGSHASGATRATRVASGCALAGGLVGESFGTIERSWASGSVAASAPAAGGLVGWNEGTITDTYATGSVEAASATQGFTCAVAGYAYGGGLVGVNCGAVQRVSAQYSCAAEQHAIIVNSYATGSVSSKSGVQSGGLLGAHVGPLARVSSSFSAGEVRGTGSGGFVGSRFGSSSFADCYWDVGRSRVRGACGISPSCADAKGVFASASFYSSTNAPLSAWDFSGTWSESTGYPALR